MNGLSGMIEPKNNFSSRANTDGGRTEKRAPRRGRRDGCLAAIEDEQVEDLPDDRHIHVGTPLGITGLRTSAGDSWNRDLSPAQHLQACARGQPNPRGITSVAWRVSGSTVSTHRFDPTAWLRV